jgi:hypothetical protein
VFKFRALVERAHTAFNGNGKKVRVGELRKENGFLPVFPQKRVGKRKSTKGLISESEVVIGLVNTYVHTYFLPRNGVHFADLLV